MKKTIIALPEPMRRRLDSIRKREGLVMGECIRQAVAYWLEHRKECSR
jgi:metal-responsive CopG/Arc/MetJ family transcriptional regulator